MLFACRSSHRSIGRNRNDHSARFTNDVDGGFRIEAGITDLRQFFGAFGKKVLFDCRRPVDGAKYPYAASPIIKQMGHFFNAILFLVDGFGHDRFLLVQQFSSIAVILGF